MSKIKIFLVSLFIVISVSSFAQSEISRTIAVQGYGQVSVKPDIANISFNLSSTNTNFKKAISKLNSKVNSLSKALKRVGIPQKDIHSSNYNINKEFKHNYKTGEKTFLGYRVSHTITLQVSSDTKSVNKVFGAIIKSLDDVELNLSFGIKNPEESKDLMIANAIKDAKKKANVMASASGVELGRIISINYNTAPSYPRGNNNYMSLSKGIAVESAPVMVDNFNPADIKQSTSVNIVWEIK